jgi:hypothetical protein
MLAILISILTLNIFAILIAINIFILIFKLLLIIAFIINIAKNNIF